MVIAVGQMSHVFSTMVVVGRRASNTNHNHGVGNVRNSHEIVTETAVGIRTSDAGGTMVVANVTTSHKNVSHGAIHDHSTVTGVRHGAAIINNMPKGRAFNADAVRFGAILRQCREARGWTRVKLATRSGMAATYIGNLEQGGNVPTISTVLELAEVLGVDAADIMRTLATARDPRRTVAPAAEPLP